MRKLWILIFPLLSACATWQGKSETALLREFGIPTQRMTTPEGELFQYAKCDGGGLTVPMNGSPNTQFTFSNGCSKRLFMLKDHVVVEDLGTKYK